MSAAAAFDQNIVSSRAVIDFHTHPYRKRGEFMGMYGEHFYLEPEQMPEDLAQAGISVFCGSVIDSDHREAMESFDRVREVNDAALELRERFGAAYVPGFHVHPAFLKVWNGLSDLQSQDVCAGGARGAHFRRG